MTRAQILEAAQLTVKLYKYNSELEIYRQYLMSSVKMNDGLLEPSEAHEYIMEDETYFTETNKLIAGLRAQIITLTRGRTHDEELAMWREERRLIGMSLEGLREFNSNLL